MHAELTETKKTKSAILTTNLKKMNSRERGSVNEVCRKKRFFSLLQLFTIVSSLSATLPYFGKISEGNQAR